MRFISPRTDFAFKKIFGSQQSKAILISFLNALIYDGRSIIEDLKIIDPYQAPVVKGIKDSFLDVKATTANHQTIIIEMQVLNVAGFEKRILYNAAKAFSIQLESGQNYTILNPVIALTITDFEMFPDSSQVISHYKLKEREKLTDYSDDLELVFVELPKFTKPLEHLETLTDKWIYFLKQVDSLETVPETFEEPAAFKQAFQIAETSNLTRYEYDILQQQQFVLFDRYNAIVKAEQQGMERGLQRGLEQGIQQGVQQGVEQGIQQGIQQGVEQGVNQSKREIARSLLDILDMETIAQKTGLTIEEIQQLA